jgi:hypothetical protein
LRKRSRKATFLKSNDILPGKSTIQIRGALMHKTAAVLVAIVLSTLVATGPSPTPLASAASDIQYEVLSPWAEVDPVPPRGLSPRLGALDGKKIGLFVNTKRAAKPMAAAIAKRLKEKFPASETSLFASPLSTIILRESKKEEAQFTAWLKSVNAVVLLVGD